MKEEKVKAKSSENTVAQEYLLQSCKKVTTTSQISKIVCAKSYLSSYWLKGNRCVLQFWGSWRLSSLCLPILLISCPNKKWTTVGTYTWIDSVD